MGRNMKRLLLFAIKHQGWQTYSTDWVTIGAVYRLEALGLIEVNREFRQFRLDQPNELRVVDVGGPKAAPTQSAAMMG